MHVILDKALTATAAYWPSLVLFFTWLGQATAILANPDRSPAARVRAQYQALLASFAAELLTPAGEGTARLGFPLPGDHPALLDRVIPLLRGRRLTAHPQRLGASVRQVASPRAPHHRTQGRHPQPDPPRFGTGTLRGPQLAAAADATPIRPGRLGAVAGRTSATRQTPADAGAPVAFPSTA